MPARTISATYAAELTENAATPAQNSLMGCSSSCGSPKKMTKICTSSGVPRTSSIKVSASHESGLKGDSRASATSVPPTTPSTSESAVILMVIRAP